MRWLLPRSGACQSRATGRVRVFVKEPPLSDDALTGPAFSERQLRAVMHADVAGYSRLIGLDDAGTLRRLRTLREAVIDPAIAAHRGRIVNTAGDSLLIVFDSAQGAVQCALRLQGAIPVHDRNAPADRCIRLRVGITVGDVISDGMDVHGDGVNIAARLESASPIGGICVSRPVRDQVQAQLGLDFEPLGSLVLKNIAVPVEAFALRLDGVAAPPAAVPRRWPWPVALTGLAALLLASGGGMAWWLRRAPPAPAVATAYAPAPPASAFVPPDVGISRAPQLSLVVLPFDNLGGDTADNYLVDGISEDLTTDLARVPGMLVIARTSAFTYRGQAVDARRIGEELGVRYVLEGSVRRFAAGLRVNAQLVSTETGTHLWADRFDASLENIAAAQDEIIIRIGRAMNVQLIDIESARAVRERPGNPDAFDLILQARALANQPPSPTRDAAVQALYQRALDKDPKSVPAMLGIAGVILARRWMCSLSSSPPMSESVPPRCSPQRARKSRIRNRSWLRRRCWRSPRIAGTSWLRPLNWWSTAFPTGCWVTSCLRPRSDTPATPIRRSGCMRSRSGSTRAHRRFTCATAISVTPCPRLGATPSRRTGSGGR